MNKKLFPYLIYPLIIFISIAYSAWSFTHKPIDINILMPAPFADSTSTIVDQYNHENKGKVHINVTRGPLETEAVSDLAISSLLLGASPFDIILIDVTWLPKYAEAGWISSLDKYIDIEEWNSLISGAQDGNSYKGNIYRWPLVADMGLLYWRSDLMKEPPQTPNQLLEISRNLVQDNQVEYGYVWQGRQYEGLSCVFLEVLHAFGGEWLDDNNHVKLSSNESIEAAKWLRKLIKVGASPKAVTNFAETEALQVFESGQAAFMRNWPYAWSELQKDSSQVKGKVGLTLMVSEQGRPSASTLGSWGLSILQNSHNKKAAYQVIRYLTSQASQKKLFTDYGYTPTSEKLFDDVQLISKLSILPELKRALSVVQARPMTPLYAQISNVLQVELSSILTANKPAEDAMRLAKDKTKRIILSSGS